MSEKQPECSIAIQVLPKVEGEEVIRVVDEVIAYLKSSGLPVFVGPFETTVERPFDQLMEMVKECQKICIRAGACCWRSGAASPTSASCRGICCPPPGRWRGPLSRTSGS